MEIFLFCLCDVSSYGASSGILQNTNKLKNKEANTHHISTATNEEIINNKVTAESVDNSSASNRWNELMETEISS